VHRREESTGSPIKDVDAYFEEKTTKIHCTLTQHKEAISQVLDTFLQIVHKTKSEETSKENIQELLQMLWTEASQLREATLGEMVQVEETVMSTVKELHSEIVNGRLCQSDTSDT